MVWSDVRLKYQLIRVTEILQSWAKFKKSTFLQRIIEIRKAILTEKLSLDDLIRFRNELIDIILASDDRSLINDLQSFIEQHKEDHHKGTGISEIT